MREAREGWLGITDKYWMTAVVPKKGENFKSTFLYKDSFKANYILNNPTTINPSSSNSNEVRLFVAAKILACTALSTKQKSRLVLPSPFRSL